MRAYIGCSGYNYREWKGRFYPDGLPSSKWLGYYAEHFNSIEINSSFYKFPRLHSFSNWYKNTPADFRFTVKANKLFTHFKKMQDIDRQLKDFNDVVFEALQDKLMCILYQFPASFTYSEERLQRILPLGDIPVRHAIEFRDISWWREDVYRQLMEAGLVFCNISLPQFPDIFVADSRANYLRFHGKSVLYKSGYGEEGLRPWVDCVLKQPAEELIVYFNNTWFVEAIKDAEIFSRLLWNENVEDS